MRTLNEICCWPAPLLLPVAGALAGEPGSDSGAEARFLSHTRQLTFEGRRSGEGYFSLDGKALIFQSEREPGNPFYQTEQQQRANDNRSKLANIRRN